MRRLKQIHMTSAESSETDIVVRYGWLAASLAKQPDVETCSTVHWSLVMVRTISKKIVSSFFVFAINSFCPE
jgi:hypothetical protein